MALDLVTGYKGAAHITAEDIGAFNAGVFGSGEYVLTSGNKLAASVISNNTVRILDGDLVIQGRHVTLKKDTYEEVTIENGETGMNRKDLIVARYTKDSTNGIENVVFAVIKGEFSDSEASDPEHTTGDILSGGCTLHEMPLYRITLTGLNVGEPEALFAVEENGLLDMSGLVFRGELTHRFSTAEESSPKYWRNIGSGVFQVPYGSYIGGTYYTKSNKGTLLNIVSANAVTQLFCTGGYVDIRTTKLDDVDTWQDDWQMILTGKKSISGTYTGDGKLSQTIDLGITFKPAAVLVTRSDGSTARSHWGEEYGTYFYGGLAYRNNPCTFWDGVKDFAIIEIVQGGFKVFCSSSGSGSAAGHVETNSESKFHYVAFLN